jgi:hypothetical protein
LARAVATLAVLAGTALVVALLAFEPGPRLSDPGPPDAVAAARTRDVVARLKAFVDSEAAELTVTETEMNAVLAAVQRVRPGLYGHATVDPEVLALAVSVGAPVLPRGLWLNLALDVAPSEEGPRIASASVGRLPIPPALALAGLRLALDRALGPGTGDDAMAAVDAVRLADGAATVAFDFPDGSRDAFFDRLRARVIAAAGTLARSRVQDDLEHLHKAVRHGTLPVAGSVLPYIHAAADFAARHPEGSDREAFRAALYALALYCGDPDFGRTIAVDMPWRMQGRRNGCEATTLAGRDDLKRHFVISAGLYAATTGTAAFGMGELKELLDSNDGGSGFSFDDMAADLAGVRFASAFLDAPAAEWPAMLEAIERESDLVPSTEGLPGGMTQAEFEARFGDVDSPAYRAMVAEIRRRVDALPLGAPELSN